MTRHGSRGRLAPRIVIAGLAVGLAVVLTGSAGGAAPAGGTAETAADGRVVTGSNLPGPDEIRHSDNIRPVANVPKQGPFASSFSIGTDLAFTGHYAISGNYDGFTVYDIAQPRAPRVVSQVLCPGGQNDVAVWGDLLFLSTDLSRSDDSCSSTPLSASRKEAWEGIKIFDIRDKAAPRYVAAVETDCGSHTHTLVPDRRRDAVLIYVSSYGPDPSFPDCQPPHDSISVIRVPLRNPAAAAVVAKPVLFPDGGNPGQPGDFPVAETTGCHDITVLPSQHLAAAACMGDGVLLDIADPYRPRVIQRVRDDQHFSFWHSATFNATGRKVVFVDELGGGMAATCNPQVGPEYGASAVYDIVGSGDHRRLRFASYFKIPRAQGPEENCVAHNGSLIPARGRDIMVQAFYQGGVTVWDFTNSRHPREIGYFERGPLPPGGLPAGGSWSAYYYNGYIYSSDLQKGLDVLAIEDRRIASAAAVRLTEFNAQTQPDYHR
ncbi:hypothetical protein [Micromonospora sp. NPDC050495]|uniref:LVIVD repeat-containing protein n=1 Tax=Micromonospora sp. NPDC050495 TaxID=3154936 RepID=UPI0033E8B59D